MTSWRRSPSTAEEERAVQFREEADGGLSLRDAAGNTITFGYSQARAFKRGVLQREFDLPD